MVNAIAVPLAAVGYGVAVWGHRTGSLVLAVVGWVLMAWAAAIVVVGLVDARRGSE